MSVEPVAAARRLAVLSALSFELPSVPDSAEELLKQAAARLRESLPPGATAEIACSGGSNHEATWRLGEVRASVRSLTLGPLAAPPEPRYGAYAAKLPVRTIEADALLVRFENLRVQGLRFGMAEMETGELRGEIRGEAPECWVALTSASESRFRATLAPADVEAFIRARTPWLRDVRVSFLPEARISVQAKVALGLVSIPGHADAKLAVEGGTRLCLTDVRATLANGRPAPPMVTERLRAANPIVDLARLCGGSLAVSLSEPTTERGLLVLAGECG
jgi:hypothetical protein